MSDFTIGFDTTAFEELDWKVALLARQDYNLGNKSDWFGSFRGGLYAFYSRLHGLATHYQLVHSWIPQPRLPVDTEYQVASILFNMDSALECLTYALNAFGFAAAPTEFRDVTDRRQLQKVKPKDLLGAPGANPPISPLLGYSQMFPRTQACWVAHRRLIDTIVDLHDVSKHREVVGVGGQHRTDVPDGFFESLAIAADDYAAQGLFWPYCEIHLRVDPKAPKATPALAKWEDIPRLEGITQDFLRLVSETGQFALNDARANIRLKHEEFLEDSHEGG